MSNEINIKIIELVKTDETSHLETIIVNDYKPFAPSYREGETIYLSRKDYTAQNAAVEDNAEFDMKHQRFTVVEVVHGVRVTRSRKISDPKESRESSFFTMEVYVRKNEE